jgi:hypothetical protein
MPKVGADPGVVDTIVASAARTSSGDSGVLTGWGVPKTLRAQLNVTTAAGTGPTLDVVLEDTLDGANWNVIGTFAQKVAPGREVINVTSPFTDRLRARWTVAGTAPSFTFDLMVYSE